MKQNSNVHLMWKSVFLLAAPMVVPAPLIHAADKPSNMSAQNVLFIMTDQQRFDALGIAGKYPFLKTPNLDALAKTGAYFTNAYTQCAVSGPTRSAILTGLTVEHTRVYTNELTHKDPVKNNFTTDKTFDQILSSHGYYTEYHGKWHAPIGWTDCYAHFPYTTPKNRPYAYKLDEFKDFEGIVDDEDYEEEVQVTDIHDKFFKRKYRPNPIDRRVLRAQNRDKLSQEELKHRKHSQPDNHGKLLLNDEKSLTAYQAKLCMDALNRAKKSKKPFSITVSFNFPHAPMLPTPKYYNMYSVEDMPVPASIYDRMIDSPYQKANGRQHLPEYGNPTLIKYMMSEYFGLVTEIDDYVGKIIEELERLKLRDNTLVVFISDHGEMLGAHGMREKNVFYEESAHVPMILNHPKHITPRIVHDKVGTISLFSTILDYLNIPHETRDSESLIPLLEGRTLKHDFVVTEWLYHNVKTQPSHMIVKGDWKLFLSCSPESVVPAVLYNLKDDPYEMNNLIGKHSSNRNKYLSRARALKDDIVVWLQEQQSEYAAPMQSVIIE